VRIRCAPALTIFGGHSGGGTPLPIPNREVKPASADGTRRATSRESRSPPNYFKARSLLRAFSFWGYDRRVELKTNGLILRPWMVDDVPAIVEACSDPEIPRWIPMIPSPYGEEDAQSFIGLAHENWERGEGYNFAIVDAADGRLAGSIAVRILRFRTGHFGYWVARDARGRGVATEALRALCRWAVDSLDVKRLELLTDPENLASQRVAEKAGFQREGLLRSSLEYRDGRRRDSILFAALPEELG
jgi:RimJ/RimL family protein N-acetyltransferase